MGKDAPGSVFEGGLTVELEFADGPQEGLTSVHAGLLRPWLSGLVTGKPNNPLKPPHEHTLSDPRNVSAT